MVKKIIKPIAFLMVLILMLFLSSFLLSPKTLPEFGGKQTASGLLAEKENSIDYIILGDSEVYASFSPMEIWKEHGLVGFSCGVSTQRAQEAYYMLEKLLENQDPKVVLIEVNFFYTLQRGFKEKNIMFDKAISQVFSVFEYHNNWKRYKPSNIKNAYSAPKFKASPMKGYYYNSKINPYDKGEYAISTNIVKEIPLAQKVYVDKIIEFFRKREVKIILYSSPSPKCWSYEKHNAIKKYAEEEGLTYLDLNLIHKELGIDWSKDTYDRGDHVNFNGAKKVTKYIGEYFKNNTNLPDRREDDIAEEWNKQLEEYLKITKQTPQ